MGVECSRGPQRRFLVTVLVLFALMMITAGPVGATSESSPEPPTDAVSLVLFYGEGCPHCDRAKQFLDGLEVRWPELVVERLEVWNDATNRETFEEVLAGLGEDPRAVPTMVVADQVWVGFSDTIAADVESVVAALIDPDGELATQTGGAGGSPAEVVDVPFFGNVDVGDKSMVVSTLLIAFVDGVNPCSLWVLSVLLALVLHSGSRARVLVVGSVFLTVTSLLYGLYMVGAYSTLDYVERVEWIRLVVAAVAGVFGVLHLKEYVTHRGVSLTIADSSKPKLYQRMRALARTDRSLPAVLAGTAVLAAGVSLAETPCTAGLPLLWTDMLAARDVNATGAALLFALYLAVFLFDELVLFGAAVVTLRATKLQEHHGRALQLISGTVMVALAVTMLVQPELLESISGTLALFGGAGAIAGLVLASERIGLRRGHQP
jgi:cytochrome c biogenesis protein CcdA/glutaredoxin